MAFCEGFRCAGLG